MTGVDKTRSRRRSALFAVLLGALLIRLPGLLWGYGLTGEGGGFVALHPDEPRFVEIARGLHEGTDFRRSYVLGLGQALRLGLAAGELCGAAPGDDRLIVLARVISLLSGLGLVAVVYALACCLSGSARTGWLAAALTACHTLCVIHSHYGTADMLYVLLLYAFAIAALRAGRSESMRPFVTACALAGAAMAVKFGLVLVPSLLLLTVHRCRRSRLQAVLALSGPIICAGVFLAVQGFAFNRESVGAIMNSMARENVGGFEHNKWANPLIYAIESLRACGLPLALCALAGLPAAIKACRISSLKSQISNQHGAIGAAFAPLLLHALAILFLNVPFSRHLLPLMPGLCLAAAHFLATRRRGRVALTALTLAWSVALALSDSLAFQSDARGKALAWMVRQAPRGTRVWTDPYVKLPFDRFFVASDVHTAQAVVRHEGWFYRFRRSELNPWDAPTAAQLYHADEGGLAWDRAFDQAVASGDWRVAFRQGPPALLPEQLLYRRLWGSFEKFCGETVVLMRQ